MVPNPDTPALAFSVPTRPAAVLWDMDGTLADTEPYWMAAERALVAEFGGSWSDADALQMVGLALPDAAAVLQGAGVAMEASAIVDRLTADVIDAIEQRGVPWRDGARELLEEIRRAGIPTALVTMSMREMALSIVGQIPFTGFDVVVAGDDAARPKPFPDPYLQAASALGVDPAASIALEDSPTGIRSALAAGTVVIGVPNIVALDGYGAHALHPDMRRLNVASLSEVLVTARAAETPGEDYRE